MVFSPLRRIEHANTRLASDAGILPRIATLTCGSVALPTSNCTTLDRSRAGGRHALMIFSSNQSFAVAQGQAIKFAQASGWAHVELRRCEDIGEDAEIIDDDTLRKAAQIAVERGQRIVVYADEIPLKG